MPSFFHHFSQIFSCAIYTTFLAMIVTFTSCPAYDLTLTIPSASWLLQFEKQDRQAASELLNYIDYFSYERICADLKLLHANLLVHIKQEEVVYSKTYVAKSGDLISYFYRTSNKIRSVLFKNISDSIPEKRNKILVLLEDYVGTGTQFLYRLYAKQHYELFNQYKKVYLVTLVANTSAIDKFFLIKSGNYDLLAEEFIFLLNCPKDFATRQSMIDTLKRIPTDKLELVYLYEEKPLSQIIHSSDTLESISALLAKYGKHSLDTNFFKSFSVDRYGHTAFFYSCPNNLPAILWDTKLLQLNGQPWLPLLKRVEDISIYDRAKTVPIEEQVW